MRPRHSPLTNGQELHLLYLLHCFVQWICVPFNPLCLSFSQACAGEDCSLSGLLSAPPIIHCRTTLTGASPPLSSRSVAASPLLSFYQPQRKLELNFYNTVYTSIYSHKCKWTSHRLGLFALSLFVSSFLLRLSASLCAWLQGPVSTSSILIFRLKAFRKSLQIHDLL